MSLSVDYVARETLGNLRRNLLMTSAAVLTVAISLALVGGVLLLKQGVANATASWQGGVQLAIFMQPNASSGESDAVSRSLSGLEPGGSDPGAGAGAVKSYYYCNQQCALHEFRTMFANQPSFLASVSAADLPPSYRVVPFQASDANVIGARFSNYPGVDQVTYAKQEIDLLVRITHDFQLGFIVLAAVMLLSALMLILNTIRMAIFARRREVTVMKLVGATNWFIRVPFMLEGLFQGIVGAAVAFVVVFVSRDALAGVVNGNHIQLFSQLVVSSGDAVGTGVVILLVGATVGAASSAVAVRRFLDV